MQKNCFLLVTRLLLLAGLLCGHLAAAQTTLYVAPTGTDSNPGTLAAPTTLTKAITTIATGGTIFMRGGTYNYSAGVTIATGNNGSKRIEAYQGEVPDLNFSGQPLADANRGFTVNGNNWYIKGLLVERAGDNGIFVGGSNNTFELCTTRYNRDSGLQIARASSTTAKADWPANNLVLNCTSYDNQDPGNENADGFACKLTSGNGNVFRGCISHNNIDDGWDFYAKTETGPIGPVTLENCVSYSNGALSNGATSGSGDKNGFKLGGSGIAVAHVVRRCVAFNNGHHGFTDNDNPGPITVTNNTSYNNADANFQFREGGSHVFTNNLSFQGKSSDKTIGTLVSNSNVFWANGASSNGKGLVVSAADFASLAVPASVGRNADGTPNLGNFLALAAGSDLINAGVTASSITYSGSAPDVGAREYGGTTTPPATYTLTVTASPAAGGTIARSPNASSYAAGTVVTLTATPASGYTFAGWSGAASGSSATTTVTVNANSTATATFTPVGTTTYTLTVTASPAAGGTVALSPAGGSYAAGTVVTATAMAASGYTFAGWSGASTATTASTTVTMSANKSLTATFTATTGGGGGGSGGTGTSCAVVGWATQNGGTTGGGSATPTVVSNYTDFKNAVTSATVKVIHVSGTITFPSAGRINFQDQSGKTIYGLPGAKLVSVDKTADGSGILYIKRSSNLIIRNLTFVGPGAFDVDGNDNMTIDNCTNVWVDHCDFQDALDGNLDIKNMADYISITWCKFSYLKAPTAGGSGGADDHRFSNLFGSSDGATGDRGKLRITMQYCWWAQGCKERMPRVRFGKVHLVNNYYSCTGNNNCIRAGLEADLRVENNYFDNVNVPIDPFENNFTAISSLGNVFVNTTGNTAGSGTAFTPPYALSVAAAANVKALVASSSCGAGATMSSPTSCCGGGGGTTPPASYTLTTTASPAAGGTIARSPDASSYAAGTVVTLTATAATGYTFAGWSGAASGTNPTTTVTVTANATATATFTATTGGGGGGGSGSTATVRLEDAASTTNGYCGADGSRQNSYSGADNGYYINLSNSSGQGIDYKVSAPAAGTYALRFRYANAGSSSATTARVLVNGASAVNSVAFPKTAAWTTWTTTTASVTLRAGVNAIRLETTQAAEFAIIDWLEVTGNSPAAASCASSAQAATALATATGAPSNLEAATLYPNPSSGAATLEFSLLAKSPVSIKVYNALGQYVATITEKVYESGHYAVPVTSKLSSGVYQLTIGTDQGKQTLRLLVQ